MYLSVSRSRTSASLETARGGGQRAQKLTLAVFDRISVWMFRGLLWFCLQVGIRFESVTKVVTAVSYFTQICYCFCIEGTITMLITAIRQNTMESFLC